MTKVRLLVQHEERRDPWSTSAGLDLDFDFLPRVGDLIDTNSAKSDRWRRVDHVLHRPNASAGDPKTIIYVTVVDPPPDLFPTKV